MFYRYLCFWIIFYLIPVSVLVAQKKIPDTPSLSSPQNNSVNLDNSLTLQWRNSPRADYYSLQLSDNNSFSTLIINDLQIIGTSRSVNNLGWEKKYYWRVRAVNISGESAWSQTWNFTTREADPLPPPPPAPLLSYPLNNSVGQDTSLIFKWFRSIGADSYTFQLSDNNLFSSFIVNQSLITDSIRSVSGLQKNKQYFWRVRAINRGGESLWSQVWNFTTKEDEPLPSPPPAPLLSYPLNNSVDQDTSLIFKWFRSTRADSYTFQLSDNNLFSSFIINQSLITDSMRSVSGLQKNKQYFWRVRAVNQGGVSAWSQIWNFTTENASPSPAPPAPPSLASPLDNAFDQSTSVIFKWFKTKTADSYRIQVSDNILFSSFAKNDSLITDTLYSVTGLASNKQYYWRVRAANQGGESPWSDVWSFTTRSVSAGVEGGYSNKMSVNKGEEIIFYISTPVSPFTLSFYKSESQQILISSEQNITGGLQALPDSSFHYGCRWNETYRFTVPASWEPGAYRAKFPVGGGSTREILFFVKEPLPGSHSNILVVVNQNTWQAYNGFGGKSFYDYNSTNNIRAYKVSFQRPPQDPNGFSDFYQLEEKFIRWASLNNYNLEYATNYDVHSNANLLSNYDLAVTVGHSEYWSRNERLQFEKFISNGGKVMILSGNTCWWQIRYEDNGKTMVCYKDKNIDPYFGVIDSLVTENWYNSPLNYPENSFTGVSFKAGGYVNWNGRLMAADGYGDYAAYNTHHWVYSGTNLNDGQEYGYETTITGYEVDRAIFNWVNGIPSATGTDKTPLNFRILGITPAILSNESTFGTMGIHTNPAGGAVFNASTVDWAEGLFDDLVVNKVTKNVMENFLSDKLAPDIISWSPSVVKEVTINNRAMFVNERNVIMSLPSSLQFSISSEDPYKGQVHYFWKVNDVHTGTGATYTFNNNNSQIRNYTLTAYAYNSRDTSSISWQITNSGAPPEIPDVPLLAAPLNNSNNISLSYIFKWYKTLKAGQYKLQISKDNSFASPIYNYISITDTAKSISHLESGTKYYWRVRAVNNDGESNWSNIWSFTTVNQFLINAMDGTFTGDARLGSMTGMNNTRVVYFVGTNGGVSFSLNIPSSNNNWFVWARMYYMSSGGKNSFFVTANGFKNILGDDDTKYDQWHWDGNNGTRINLGTISPGVQTLIISGREPGTSLWIDQLILTDDQNFLPDGFVLKDNGSNIPLPPQLISPPNATAGQQLQLNLNWKSSAGATRYILNVSDNITFSNLLYNDNALTDTFKSIGPLKGSTKYYWRVKAANIKGESNWSQVWNFTTSNQFLLNAMDGTLSGDARLGSMTGMNNSRAVYFVGTNGGVSFTLNIPSSTKNWYVWGRMYYMSSGGKNSFFVSANGNKKILGDDDSKYDQWHWDGYNGVRIDLGVMSSGQQTLMVSGREPGTTLWIDQLILTDDENFLPPGFIIKGNNVPLPVQLFSPPNASLNQSVLPGLRWKKSENAARYILHVSRNSDFSTLLYSDSTLIDSTRTIGQLVVNTQYYWRVKAVNLNGESSWSEIWNFTTNSHILLDALNGSFSGDARLGSMAGMKNTRAVYFVGTNGGVSFNVNITKTGTWYAWGRMYYMSSGGKNSFFINSKGSQYILGDNDSKYDQWHWDGYQNVGVNLGTLSAGVNTVSISGREPGTTLWIDQIILTDDPTYNPNTALGKYSDKGTEIVENLFPTEYNLSQNYPNPFNPSTVIKFSIPEDQHVSLKIFDVTGREVISLIDEPRAKGFYEITLDANYSSSGFASGVYFYVFRAGEYVQNRKMIFMK